MLFKIAVVRAKCNWKIINKIAVVRAKCNWKIIISVRLSMLKNETHEN